MSHTPGDCPPERIPKRLAYLFEGACGPNRDFIWEYGEGPFLEGPFAPQLKLVPDRPGHGVVEAQEPVTIDGAQAALAATRSGWSRVY